MQPWRPSMPNSAWTETGTAINLVPVTTPIAAPVESVDYLSNADKIRLMAEYSAELAMKTQLDTTASSLSLSSTGYDNSVANINTVLINAGAPSNWATIWPDGTTFGPSTGIQTQLATAWASVASNRTALQTAISDAQAAAAQAAAVAAAASDATTKANNAYANALAKAVTMAVSESIISNGGFTTGDGTGWSWGEGTNVGGSAASAYGTLPNSQGGITVPGGGFWAVCSPVFRVTPGRKYKLIYTVWAGSGSQSAYLRVSWANSNVGVITNANRSGTFDFIGASAVSTTAGNQSTYDWTCPAGVFYATLSVIEWSGATAPLYVQSLAVVPYLEAAYVDAGAITAAAIAADAISSASIQAGAITTNKLAVTSSGLALNNDPFCTDATAWTIGDGGSFSVVPVTDGLVGLSAIQMSSANVRSLPVPITPGKTYRVKVTARALGSAASSNYIRFYQFSAAAVWSPTGWPSFDNLLAFSLGEDNISIGTSWTTYTATVTAVSGAVVGALSFHGGTVQIQDFEIAEQADASLIVDGTITSAKIQAGAITGNMITTGVLTADVIFFSDGFCLNTLEPKEAGADVTRGHYLTSVATISSGFSLADDDSMVSLTGLSFTSAASGSNDVYNFQGSVSINFEADPGVETVVEVFFYVCVDGNTSVKHGAGDISIGTSLPDG